MAVSPTGYLRRFFGSAVSNAAGYAIGGAVQPVLEPVVQDLANEAWETHPVKPLGSTTAARAAAEGVMAETDAQAEAALTGIGAERYRTLRELATDYPELGTLLELRRRDLIDDAEFDLALQRSSVPASWRTRMLNLRRYLIPPSDLIRNAVREVYDPGQRAELDLDADFPTAFAQKAAALGITEDDARDLWAAHWNLPSYEQGAEMLHRGELTPQQFSNLLRAQDYAPTWRGKLEAIARRIPPLTDMIRFAVREVYDPAKRQALGLDAEYPDVFTQQAALHGMDERHAREYWAAHWRLPSATQGYQMLWRGEITIEELDGLLKAIDYPTQWRDRLRNIAYHVPGRIDLRRMYAAGLIDRPRLVRGYRELGYNAENAELLADFAIQLASGSSAGEKWADRARGRLYTVTHDEYLDESLTEAAARDALDLVGVPEAEQDTIFTLWNRERQIARLELTPAQVKKAYTKDVIPLAEAMQMLEDRGMTIEDAETFLQS